MPRPGIALPAALLIAVAVVTVGLAPAYDVARQYSAAAQTAPAAPNEVLVGLTADAFALSDDQLLRSLHVAFIERMEPLTAIRAHLHHDEDVGDAVKRLATLESVVYAEPNHILQGAGFTNDNLADLQTSYFEDIQAPSAWARELGHDSLLVAVLDSGLDLTHPDLQQASFFNIFEIENNGIDDDGNGCVDDVFGCSFVSSGSAAPACPVPGSGNIADDNGHGTFVSGIIASRGNNGIGISGAAPNVRVLPVKILDCLGGGTAADAAQGLLYAARAGARVANISFGADGISQTLTAAIQEAYGQYGMTIVAATGNQGNPEVSFPAKLPEVIAVAASGTAEDPDARAPFSDWGPEVDVAAPGSNVVSTVPLYLCDAGWYCVDGEPYAIASGTSFAAPFVSALAALLISEYPFIAPEAVRSIIMSTALPLPDADTPDWDGFGRIRMRFALDQPRYYLGAAGVSRP